jgi:hypothetical protein
MAVSVTRDTSAGAILRDSSSFDMVGVIVSQHAQQRAHTGAYHRARPGLAALMPDDPAGRRAERTTGHRGFLYCCTTDERREQYCQRHQLNLSHTRSPAFPG